MRTAVLMPNATSGELHVEYKPGNDFRPVGEEDPRR